MVYFVGEAHLGVRVPIRKERLLPMRGDVLVTIDDRVDATDIVARATGAGRLHLLEAAQALNVKPQELKRFTIKRVGDPAKAGDVLATRPRVGNILPRIVRAPAEGRIVAALGGRLLFEETPTPLELRAEVSGRVIGVMPSRGVVIEAVGIVVQAAWGCGGKANGVLRLVVRTPDVVVGAESLDVACLGSILIGGAGVTEAALREAERLKARGLILGGLSSALIPLARSLSFPVLITEGFGPAAMNHLAFDLLAGAQGREASLEPGNMDSWSRLRPEIIIPEPMTTTAPSEPAVDDRLVSGAVLRAVRQPNVGVLGEYVDLTPRPVLYENGMRLPSVLLRKGETSAPITIPVMNVERVR